MIESPDSLGATPSDNNATRWTMEMDNASKHERDWRERAQKVMDRYRLEGKWRKEDGNKFNILWSNTETLKPAIYSQTPIPDVRRRYADMPDDQADRISTAIERGLEYSMNSYGFDKEMFKVRDDYLLPGRGLARVRYTPTMGDVSRKKEVDRTDGGGYQLNGEDVDPSTVLLEAGVPYIYKTQEELVYATVTCEYVPWKWYRQSPASSWLDVTWQGFGQLLTRDECVKYFGRKTGNDIALTYGGSGSELQTNKPESASDNQSIFLKAEVWEIWDKDTKQVFWWSDGYPGKIIKTIDDPLELEDFFPTPEPLYSIRTNGTMTPIPEYVMYQDQAEELDILTTRIAKLVDAIRARGIYAGDEKATLDLLFRSDESVLIPYPDWASMQDKGGLDNLISWVPIEQFGKVLSALYQKRDTLIQQIYDLTGISDVMRGSTDPRETKGAQDLKAQYGTRRLLPRARDFQYFVRDLLRLKAEVMCKHFTAQTWYQMTGIKLSPEDMKLMHDDSSRCFHIDVETDSTTAPNDQEEKQNVSEFIGALGQFATQIAPLVQMGVIPSQSVGTVMQWAAGKFKVSRDLQEQLKATGQPTDPNQIAQQQAQQQQQQAAQQQQFEQQQAQAQQQHQQQLDQAQISHKQTLDMADMKTKQAKAAQDMQISAASAELDRQIIMEKHLQDMKIKEAVAQAQLKATKNKPQGN